MKLYSFSSAQFRQAHRGELCLPPFHERTKDWGPHCQTSARTRADTGVGGADQTQVRKMNALKFCALHGIGLAITTINVAMSYAG